MGSLAWYKVTKGSPDMELPTPSLPGVRVISSFGKYKIPRKDLVISNADKSHRGFYMCQLTDRGSTLKKSVHVDVKGKFDRSCKVRQVSQGFRIIRFICTSENNYYFLKV